MKKVWRNKLDKTISVNIKLIPVITLIDTGRKLRLGVIIDAIVKRDCTRRCGESGLFKGNSVVTNR